MAIAPKTIALTVGGVLAPILGDVFTQSVSPSMEIMGGPVEFAVNANGETYGSPVNDQVPDLILTKAEGGKIGYVRVSELEFARNLRSSNPDPNEVIDIDVYESDGVTVIGNFRVLVDTPGPRDGFN
jgi:hypothetical protein